MYSSSFPRKYKYQEYCLISDDIIICIFLPSPNHTSIKNEHCLLYRHFLHRYEEDGAIVLRSVVSEEWLEKLRNVSKIAMAEKAPSSFDHEPDTSSTGIHVNDFVHQITYISTEYIRSLKYRVKVRPIHSCNFSTWGRFGCW